MNSRISLPRQQLALTADVDISLRDLVINGDWITGVVDIHVEIAGITIDQSVPFTVQNGGTIEISLPYDVSAKLRVYLRDARTACGVVSVTWGPITLPPAEECVSV